MGAAPSHPATLDAIQTSAGALIGADGPALDSLDHRRRVGALTYLYKLQCWDPPPRLQRLVPPRLSRPTLGMTRASQIAYTTWHANKFENVLPVRSLDNARRAFPYSLICDWNALPAWFFDNGFDLAHLQSFKLRVHQHLGGQAVLNPALQRLRGRGARRN